MPTYDYLCKTCGLRFEHFQSITSDALTRCPAEICRMTDERKGEGEVVRLISGGAGLVFKGEGFYLTDYARKESGGKGGGASTSAKTGDGSSGSTGAPTGGDAKGSESAAGESKGSGTKGSETKGGESAGSGAKPSSGSEGTA